MNSSFSYEFELKYYTNLPVQLLQGHRAMPAAFAASASTFSAAFTSASRAQDNKRIYACSGCAASALAQGNDSSL
jgi:hypothetical protein